MYRSSRVVRVLGRSLEILRNRTTPSLRNRSRERLTYSNRGHSSGSQVNRRKIPEYRNRSRLPVVQRRLNDENVEERHRFRENYGNEKPPPHSRQSTEFEQSYSRRHQRSSKRFIPSRAKEYRSFESRERKSPPHREADFLQGANFDRDARTRGPYNRLSRVVTKGRDDFTHTNTFVRSRSAETCDGKKQNSFNRSVRPPPLPESSPLQPKLTFQGRLTTTVLDPQEPPLKCTSCTHEELAIARCRDCSYLLCRSCLAAHKVMHIFASHQVEEFQRAPPYHASSNPENVSKNCQLCFPQLHSSYSHGHSCYSPGTPETLWGSKGLTSSR